MNDEDLDMYDRLAGWFHLLTPPSDYSAEAAEALDLLRSRADGAVETVLELGSGGGNVASHLAGEVRLTLTDRSPAMLEVSLSLNPGIEHLEGDMRTLRLERTFDAVIIHDAVGYMTSEADLRAAMETAWVHLRAGGVVLLQPDWVLDEYQPHTEHGGSDEGERGLRYLEWDRGLEPDGHTVKTDYLIITRDGDDVSVYHDVHTLGIFERAAWLRLLAEVGFQPERIVGAEGMDIFIGVRPV